MVSATVERIISCFFSEQDTSNERDTELLKELFETATVEFDQIIEQSSGNAAILALDKAVYISELRSAPNKISRDFLLSAPPSAIQTIQARTLTLIRYLLAFQPAILKSVEDFFAKMDAGVSVEFFPKTGGLQVGTIAKVSYSDGSVATYFVKAHQNYQVTTDSFAHMTSDKAHYVDYKELFVYRVLGALGVGPTVEFILSGDIADPTVSETGLLIASLDLAQPTAAGRATSFSPFEFLRSDIRRRLRGEGLPVSDSSLEAGLNEALHLLFSSHIARHDLKSIDLLCRIMNLNDVLINKGNFGQLVCTGVPAEEVGWRIVDFTVGIHRKNQKAIGYAVADIKRQYERVGGAHLYENNLPLRRVLLEGVEVGRDVKEELQRGRGSVPSLSKVLSAAYEEVVGIIEINAEMLHLKDVLHDEKISDLQTYMSAILDNLDAV